MTWERRGEKKTEDGKTSNPWGRQTSGCEVTTWESVRYTTVSVPVGEAYFRGGIFQRLVILNCIHIWITDSQNIYVTAQFQKQTLLITRTKQRKPGGGWRKQQQQYNQCKKRGFCLTKRFKDGRERKIKTRYSPPEESIQPTANIRLPVLFTGDSSVYFIFSLQ